MIGLLYGLCNCLHDNAPKQTIAKGTAIIVKHIADPIYKSQPSHVCATLALGSCTNSILPNQGAINDASNYCHTQPSLELFKAMIAAACTAAQDLQVAVTLQSRGVCGINPVRVQLLQQVPGELWQISQKMSHVRYSLKSGEVSGKLRVYPPMSTSSDETVYVVRTT